jgi:tetratricopeptide (TPR) repeat protein
MELAPDDVATLYNLAYTHLVFGRNAAAVEAFERVLRRIPDDPLPHHGRGQALERLGHLEAALADFLEVLEADSGDRHALESCARLRVGLGRYEAALATCREARSRFPALLAFGSLEVSCLRALGRVEEARESALALTTGDAPEGQDPLDFAYLCAAAGRRERAAGLLAEFNRTWDGKTSYVRARIHAVLGDPESALRWLRQAVEGGYRRPGCAVPDPDFAPLADDPGYRALLEEMLRE